MRRVVISLLMALISVIGHAQGFNLIVVGDPQPQTEEQMRRLEEHIAPHINEIVAEYQATGLPTAILLTGDVVWDSMELLPRVKALFESFGVPVYSVIGNHDHDRTQSHDKRLAESVYEATLGPRYYSFAMGDTHFFALDNINYKEYENYTIKVDREQMKWLREEINKLPDNQRIAILMHAPAVNYNTWRVRHYAKRIMRLADNREIHFITGHRHRHATANIRHNVIEHSVAQVNGNLWHSPMCADGTPYGVFCIEERGESWTWQYRLLGESSDTQLLVWQEGEVKNHEDSIIVKAIGWDDRWQVEWFENGEKRGAMDYLEMYDPGYMNYVEYSANYNDVIMQRLRRSAYPTKGYYKCKRTIPNSEITIIATDRFGRQYKWNSATK